MIERRPVLWDSRLEEFHLRDRKHRELHLLAKEAGLTAGMRFQISYLWAYITYFCCVVYQDRINR